MMSEKRIGRFTSSQIYKLMAKGRGSKMSAKTLTYVEEVLMERLLGRPLNHDVSGRSASWGNALETRAVGMVDLIEWKYQSSETILHPTCDWWCGTPDLVSKTAVGDIKCPYTLKSFVQLVDICLAADQNALLKNFPEYYWQLVSNAILTGTDEAWLFVYCPYKSELDEIRDSISQLDDMAAQTEYQWIAFSRDDQLPWIPDDGYYKNFNSFCFSVSQEDIILLSDKVETIVKELCEKY